MKYPKNHPIDWAYGIYLAYQLIGFAEDKARSRSWEHLENLVRFKAEKDRQ